MSEPLKEMQEIVDGHVKWLNSDECREILANRIAAAEKGEFWYWSQDCIDPWIDGCIDSIEEIGKEHNMTYEVIKSYAGKIVDPTDSKEQVSAFEAAKEKYHQWLREQVIS